MRERRGARRKREGGREGERERERARRSESENVLAQASGWASEENRHGDRAKEKDQHGSYDNQ